MTKLSLGMCQIYLSAH